MAKGAAKTGVGPTVMVAIEQFLPDKEKVIRDEYAYAIISPGMRIFTSLMRFRGMREWMVKISERDFPGIWAGILLRKKYIDDKLFDNLVKIKQIVNLGAGLDTRAFRLTQVKDIPFFELDQPDNIKMKQTGIKKAMISCPKNLKLIPIDFDRENIGIVLKKAGYIDKCQTFFIWEGVSQYLTKEGISSTFEYLSNAPKGSQLAFSYVRRDFIEGNNKYGNEKDYDKYVVKEKIWIFGMNPEEWPEFLTGYGWKLIEDVSTDQIFDKYIKPTGRLLLTSPIERLAYAEKI